MKHKSLRLRRDKFRGRTGYMLLLVVVLQSIYPITSSGNLAILIFYQMLYAGMFVVAWLVAANDRREILRLTISGLLWLVSGFFSSLTKAILGNYSLCI